MPIKLQPLRSVLKHLRQWKPGILLWELAPELLVMSMFRDLEESDAVAHWDIDRLIEAVEADYARMSPEEREEVDQPRYMWGYTDKGLVAISVMDPEEGMLTQFIEVHGTPLRKLSGNYYMGDGLPPKKCTYCGDPKDPAGMVLGPVLYERKMQTRFCDEFCLDLWTRGRAQKNLPKLKSGHKRIVPRGHADSSYHGGYVE